MVYDSVARKTYNSLTKSRLEEFKIKTNSHKIQKIMFKSMNSYNDCKGFQNLAIKTYNEAKKANDVLLMNSTKLIVRRFVYDVEELKFHGRDERFLNYFFKQKDIKKIMYERNVK